jgi:tRNA U34 5-methylaminomethyl-2-thiouridine-forming methyltransferase MnmC
VRDAYELVRLKNDSYSIHSVADGETFHPATGPSAEAEALYVQQLQLRKRLSSCAEEFVIWDVGLGAAANSITALKQTSDIASTVRMVSFDRTMAALAFALQHRAALEYPVGFEQPIETLLSEQHVEFTNGAQRVTWEVVLGDFPSALSKNLAQSESARSLPAPHAIFFDAFSPARNAEMWTRSVLSDLHASLDPNRPCGLATYSRSTIARTSLLLAGFWVGAGLSMEGKEETTMASNDQSLVLAPLGDRWLIRVRRSHGAEPLEDGVYRQLALTGESWARLRKHPQFAGITLEDASFSGGKPGAQ